VSASLAPYETLGQFPRNLVEFSFLRKLSQFFIFEIRSYSDVNMMAAEILVAGGL
jgi:hypothetical protein